LRGIISKSNTLCRGQGPYLMFFFIHLCNCLVLIIPLGRAPTLLLSYSTGARGDFNGGMGGHYPLSFEGLEGKVRRENLRGQVLPPHLQHKDTIKIEPTPLVLPRKSHNDFMKLCRATFPISVKRSPSNDKLVPALATRVTF
jgi:hypothetical protein